jgi:hypothetical protein
MMTIESMKIIWLQLHMLHKVGRMRVCIVVASCLTGMELNPHGYMTKDPIEFTRCQYHAITKAINPKRSQRKKALSLGAAISW